MHKTVTIVLLSIVLISACSQAEPVEHVVVQVSATPSPRPIQTATSTPSPTATVEPTSTQTLTPLPTQTVEPTRTPNLRLTATAQVNDSLVREAYEQYRSAVINGDGTAALEVLSSSSISWYEYILADSLSLNREELDQRDLVQQLIILRLRYEFSREELQNFTADEIIIIAIENGWVGQFDSPQLDIDTIRFNSSGAHANFEGMPPEFELSFSREEGRYWRISLFGPIWYGNLAFEQLIEESGLTKDEFFILMLETLSDNPVDERIFDGPKD